MKKFAVIASVCSLAILAIISLAALRPPEDRAAPAAPGTESGTRLAIRQGTVGTYGGLRIGVVSVGWKDVRDAEGGVSTELVGALQIFSRRGDDQRLQSFDIQIGQEIEFDGYVIRVQDIEYSGWAADAVGAAGGLTGQGNGTVTLTVR